MYLYTQAQGGGGQSQGSKELLLVVLILVVFSEVVRMAAIQHIYNLNSGRSTFVGRSRMAFGLHCIPRHSFLNRFAKVASMP